MISANRKICCICSKEVILVILWDALINLQVFTISSIDAGLDQNYYNIVIDITLCLMFLIFPFFGLLADLKTGRYKSIIIGVHISFIAWIIGGLALTVNSFIKLKPLFFSSLFFYLILQMIGYGTVHSNIVQFNIDQSVGVSANQLSAIIFWHYVSTPIVFTIIIIVKCLFNEFALFVFYISSGVAVCTVIISNLLFKHWLDTKPYIINPIKLIAKVLNYAWNNKYPRNRSALTYWEEDYPSQLDLGKEKYGGPFSVEEVEDVKTVLRLIPLLICVIGGRCAEDYGWNRVNQKDQYSHIIFCLILNDSHTYLVSSFLLLFYHFVIYPCFHNFIPSMLKRLGLGLMFALSYPVSHLIITLYPCFHNFIPSMLKRLGLGLMFALSYPVSHLIITLCQNYLSVNVDFYKVIVPHFVIYPCFHNFIPSMLKRLGLGLMFALSYPVSHLIITLCQNYLSVNVDFYKVIVPQILLAISKSIIFPISLEFTIAQCPHQLRGFMVGLWFAANGIGFTISSICKYSFKCEAEMICQSIFYYLVKSIVVFVILILFLILAKRYKLRMRDNEVNIHLIAEEHYERYMKQEIEYRKEVGLSLESTD